MPSIAVKSLDVVNPTDETVIGAVACTDIEDLENAAGAAHKGFTVWCAVFAFEHAKLMREAAALAD